jgi:hypothetical protein
MKTIKRPILILLFLCIALKALHSQPTDHVLAYYPFNESPLDVTGNGMSGTTDNVTPIADRLGATNKAYYFNGVNSQIYLPNNLLTDPCAFSVSCWIKISGDRPADAYNGQEIIDFRGMYNTNIGYYQSNNPTYPNAIGFNIANYTSNISCISPANSIQFNTWYHIAATYGNNTMGLYINGTLVSSQSQTPPNLYDYPVQNMIGKDYKGSWVDRLWFYGCIDEVLIYGRGLTATEVQQLYNRGLSSSEITELFQGAKVPITYAYDEAGNRTDRYIIIMNAKSAAVVRRDSLSQLKSEKISKVYDDHLGDHDVLIYPNPTLGKLKIDITGLDATQNSIIEIYNVQGNIILQTNPATGSDQMDLSSFPNGTYIMRITLGDKKREWRILKQ